MSWVLYTSNIWVIFICMFECVNKIKFNDTLTCFKQILVDFFKKHFWS